MRMITFEERKKRALKRLAETGADADIIEILERINSIEKFFTTSSCSGRIVLLKIPHAGSKREAKFIAKWHRPVSAAEVLHAIDDSMRVEGCTGECEEIWLIEQPPIIHVACRDMRSAEEMLKIAYASGFKYSNLKSLKHFIVEILSTERMDVPLCECGRMLCTSEYVEFVVLRANFLLNRAKKKLKRLLENLWTGIL
ncbi:MAG: hypothetical protein OCU22_02200 [Canidatus Methanoxibalbensis ujae]|nr:hypothetical protein [Candidatus Methanoxibalbensis ujae]